MLSPPSSPHAYFDPDSSSASSPAGPVDSSPPSSPSLQPASLSPPISPGPPHPYAASTKAAKQPRLYEKREAVVLDDDGLDLSDDDGVLSFTCPAVLWQNSPQKRSRKPQSHARSHSGTSSQATEASLDDTIRLPLFRSARVQRRSASSDSRDELAAIDLSDDDRFVKPVYTVGKTRRRREQELWDTKITSAIDTADGYIDLQQEGLISAGLNFIPPSVADLASLVVLPEGSEAGGLSLRSPPRAPVPRARPFVRAVSFPAGALHRSPGDLDPAIIKSTSVNFRDISGPHIPKSSDITLLLGNNTIQRLPLELFSLKNLTILSMRNNLLTHIPPQIALLVKLKELNVAQNRLTFLPAEMLEMRLDVLQLEHNPWRQPPLAAQDSSSGLDSDSDFGRSSSAGTLVKERPQNGGAPTPKATPITTPPTVRFTIPSLMEYCLRVLLAPYCPSSAVANSSSPQTWLEAMYALPLSNIEHYPSALLETLRACVPRAIAKPDLELQASPRKRSRISSVQSDIFGPEPSHWDTHKDEDKSEEEIPPGIGTCMAPIHPPNARPVFVDHAVERFAWVHTIASQPVHEDGGVPVWWRGCMADCLDFLGCGSRSIAGKQAGGLGEVSDKFDLSESDGETDLQAIDLGGGLDEDFH